MNFKKKLKGAITHLLFHVTKSLCQTGSVKLDSTGNFVNMIRNPLEPKFKTSFFLKNRINYKGF
jgi:nucleoid DNA-binding protein